MNYIGRHTHIHIHTETDRQGEIHAHIHTEREERSINTYTHIQGHTQWQRDTHKQGQRQSE